MPAVRNARPTPRTDAPPAPNARRGDRPRTFLPEVQALRALAVALVVLYHFWPNRLTGGFVGVDVFFVISGFLITSHLHREVETTGRIRLAHFYTRRARRLLPAALLVLLTSAAATVFFLPVTRLATTAGELLASALYAQNWLLASRAVDYSASQDAASTVQHYWSLSVEEQFYLLWPPLILLLLLLARRLSPARRDLVLLGGILVVSGTSLAWSIHATRTEQAAAYFITPTRLWELGAGAALALGMRAWHRRAQTSTRTSGMLPVALRWLGLAAIATAALTLSSASPFPGYVALLPVLGTVAVIAAGDTGRRDPLSHLVPLRPVQFLGDVSYSLYLWHWPAIVVLPFVLHRAPTAADKLLLLVMSVGLAWLTKALVEDPGRRWRLLGRPRVAGVAVVASMLLVAATSGAIWHQVKHDENAALARVAAAASNPCFGAGATNPKNTGCGDPFRSPESLTLTGSDVWYYLDPGCRALPMPPPMEGETVCRFSDRPPTRTVALVGDSHALHYQGALISIAKQLNWQIVEFTKGHCPVLDAPVLEYDGTVEQPGWVDGCRQFADRVDEQLAHLKPDYVFTSGDVDDMRFDQNPARSIEAGAQGFTEVWQRWAAEGMHVVVLRDVPSTGHVSIPDCLATNLGNPVACSQPRDRALPPDAITVAAQRNSSGLIKLVDLSNEFCDQSRCYAAIGGAVVYSDTSHITTQFSRSLAPFLLQAMGGSL